MPRRACAPPFEEKSSHVAAAPPPVLPDLGRQWLEPASSCRPGRQLSGPPQRCAAQQRARIQGGHRARHVEQLHSQLAAADAGRSRRAAQRLHDTLAQPTAPVEATLAQPTAPVAATLAQPTAPVTLADASVETPLTTRFVLTIAPPEVTMLAALMARPGRLSCVAVSTFWRAMAEACVFVIKADSHARRKRMPGRVSPPPLLVASRSHCSNACKRRE
jgi:hypothetical protein